MAKGNSTNGRVGFWQMWRDIFVTSMNKGQFPMALVGVIILFLLWKMPNQDVSTLVFKIFGTILSGSLVGWLLSIGLSVAWFLHAKHQRRVMHDEIKRISEERNKLQTQLLGTRLTSSKIK